MKDRLYQRYRIDRSGEEILIVDRTFPKDPSRRYGSKFHLYGDIGSDNVLRLIGGICSWDLTLDAPARAGSKTDGEHYNGVRQGVLMQTTRMILFYVYGLAIRA